MTLRSSRVENAHYFNRGQFLKTWIERADLKNCWNYICEQREYLVPGTGIPATYLYSGNMMRFHPISMTYEVIIHFIDHPRGGMINEDLDCPILVHY